MKIGKKEVYFSGAYESYDFVLGVAFNLRWLNMKNKLHKMTETIIPISILFWQVHLHIVTHQ